MKKLLVSLFIAAGLTPSGTVARAATFDGSCQFDNGAFTYSRPVGLLPTHVAWTLDETGRCSGRLNGRPVTAAPTAIHEQLVDDIGGCGPFSDAHGPGLLTFASGVQLHYVARHGIGLGQPLLARGQDGGLALGIAEAFTQNKPSALQQCATNSYTSGPILYLMQTLSELRG
jgi:hypothetical protein